MGARRYVYKIDCNGNVRALPVEIKVLRGTPDDAGKSFHERVFDAYRQTESDGTWQGPYPKGMVKRVHESAIARGE